MKIRFFSNDVFHCIFSQLHSNIFLNLNTHNLSHNLPKQTTSFICHRGLLTNHLHDKRFQKLVIFVRWLAPKYIPLLLTYFQKTFSIVTSSENSVEWKLIPREARRGAPSREVYNLVAREARVYHSSIARPAWFPLGYKSIEFGWCPPWRHPE